MTRNYSPGLSGEYYISRDLLTEIGNAVTVGGVLWLAPDTQLVVGINSLTANILCTRHNSSLSQLDAHAGKFMRILKNINNDLDNSSPDDTNETNYLVSGEIIECWMLKVILGIYFWKNAGGGDGPAIDQFPLDMNRVLDALYKQSWGKRCGSYLACPAGTEMKSALSFEVMLLSTGSARRPSPTPSRPTTCIASSITMLGSAVRCSTSRPVLPLEFHAGRIRH
jgi:hypothetical protein